MRLWRRRPRVEGGSETRAQHFEAFLAKLYVDPEALARFLRDPRAEAERAGLAAAEREAAARIDRTGLELAAESFAHKRQARASGRRRTIVR